MKQQVFNKAQQEKAEFILNHPLAKLSDLRLHEIQDLAVVWSYYSGKIENNSYTYVEAEVLLKDGITSEKQYEDADMLKNLYDAFILNAKYIYEKKEQVIIDEYSLQRIHQAISKGSILDKDRLRDILQEQEQYANPLERAVYLHCNIAKLQPFIDGNKRTSRMVESIALMNADIIPVYSSKDADILNYRKGLIAFYETGDYSPYADYFLNKQLERIKEIE